MLPPGLLKLVMSPGLDWVNSAGKYNGNRCCLRFRGECGSGAARCHDDGHLPTHKLRRDFAKSILLPLCPAVFDCYILVLDIACLLDASRYATSRCATNTK